ncbi:cell division protein FtsK [Clostridium botulinum]|uniref:Cell division protein FtsK n=1 Tax=Clostridium botulinum TaxID=1491 RepID=A0A6M0STF4_CLOBO|nr:cell division protein FtsK [Clostridium botulinum]HBJ1646015.1 cell division protein FtsK [Clostridium botulinum]
MLTEGLIIGSVAATYWNWNKIKIYKKWKEIMYSKTQFTNRLDKTLKILKIYHKDYGYIITIELPYSYTLKDLEKDLDILSEGLHFKSIQLRSENNVVTMYCINNYNFKEYEPIKLSPNKLLISDSITNPIIVDMDSFPHLLIGGDTGTGKSRILLLILTNLIKYNTNVDIHLLQIRKNDLGVFNNCKQVKTSSKSLEEVLEALEDIDKKCLNREKLIDNTKGYYNISDYNKKNPRLNYIYVVIEEFSFLNISKGDSKEEKRIKSKCLKYIKTIVNVGRSSGVFLITALQKPTTDSIPSDIKAQLSTRVSLLIKDGPAAKVILGNENSNKLSKREVIVKTLNEEKGYSYTIDHDIIMKNIKDKIIKKTEKSKKEKPIENDLSNILKVLNEINR